MQHLLLLFKHTDIYQRLGMIGTLLFGGVSLTAVNAAMQFLFLLVSIVLGIVTILHTQEKRKALKKQLKDGQE